MSLVGTTWLINSDADMWTAVGGTGGRGVLGNEYFYGTFESNNLTFSHFDGSQGYYGTVVKYGNAHVWNRDTGWIDEAYRTVTFTSVSNDRQGSAEAWINANAVQVIPPVDYKVTDVQLNSIADAINTKAGTTGQLQFPDGFVSAINAIPSGGGAEADWNDVIFYDYDGKRLYSYSAADFVNLSAMPANPTHQGLTAQGWNWTLSDAKTFVATYGVLDIGQMYTTSDGKTRLYLDISNENVLNVRIDWKQTVTRGVTVDFGDGTSTTTVSGTGNVNINHTYNSTGFYIVTFNVTSGTMTVKSPYYPTNYGKTSSTYLTAVEIGNNVTELDVLQNNNKLKYITIPNSVTKLPANNFCGNAWSLEHITLPNSVTTIGATIFMQCYSLKSASMPKQVVASGTIFSYCQLLNRVAIDFSNTTTNTISQYSYTARDVVIPSGVTTISTGAFSYNQRVSTFIIPSSVTTISTSAFSYCNGATEFHFKSSTPPTLANANAFTGTSSASVFYVPSASLDAYKTANNWSTYASRMVGE